MTEQVLEDQATYNLHNNQLTFLFSRRGEEEFKTLRTRFRQELRMSYGPGRKCFYGVWSPKREDAILEHVEEIDFIIDDDAGYTDRLERFAGYRSNAAARSSGHHDASRRATDGIPLGQPILVGHHSERRHRADIARSRSHASQAVAEYYKSEGWKNRIEAARGRKAHSEAPDVIKRRLVKYQQSLKIWQKRAESDERTRWITHLEMLVEYQQKLYQESGMTAVDAGEVTLEVGGAVFNFLWNRSQNKWLPIIKLNKKSVTYLTAYTDLNDPHTRTMKLDDIGQALAKDEYLTHSDWEQYGQPMWDAHFKETPKESKLKKGDGLFYQYAHWAENGWRGPVLVTRENKKTISVQRRYGRHNRLEPDKLDKWNMSRRVIPAAEYVQIHNRRKLLINMEALYISSGFLNSGGVYLDKEKDNAALHWLMQQDLVHHTGDDRYVLDAHIRHWLIEKKYLYKYYQDQLGDKKEHHWGKWVDGLGDTDWPARVAQVKSELDKVLALTKIPKVRCDTFDDLRVLRNHLTETNWDAVSNTLRCSFHIIEMQADIWHCFLEMWPPKARDMNWFVSTDQNPQAKPILFWNEMHDGYGRYFGLRTRSYSAISKNVKIDLSSLA